MEAVSCYKIKPFIKWAGGKGQLIEKIRSKYPNGFGHSITRYAEPFIGGGAVFFDVLENYSLDEIYISDINAELINTYNVIKKDVGGLVALLKEIEAFYLPLSTDERKAYYYEKRQRFNDLKAESILSVELAALFIFLNKTCFNGLFRVNKSGQFNVPIGSYKKPLICDENNLLKISDRLKNVKIVCGDYRLSADFINKNTFVYFDPPYRPLTETASFTSYAETVFDDKAQIELAEFVKSMSTKNAHIVVSNSDPKNSNAEDDFFDNLYANFQINRVEATRMINSNGKSRGKITELLITNY